MITSALTLPIGSMHEAPHIARRAFRHVRFIGGIGVMLGAMPGMWTLPAQPRPPVVTQQQTQVRGVVVDSAGRPLAEADVLLGGTNLRVRTDETGRFAFRTRQAGPFQLRVRKIEYRLYEQTIEAPAGSDRSVRVVMQRLPPLLDTVRARVDPNTCAPSSLEGFECRRASGVGYFRDAGELRSMRPQDWADMFDGMPGLRRVMVNGPYGREWRIEPRPSRCLVELWNGQRAMPSEEGGFPPDMIWRPLDVVAIEYYDEFRKVPERYRSHVVLPGSEPCELVVYWLRGAARSGP